MEGTPLISVRLTSLSKGFPGKTTPALSKIEADIKSGCVTGIVGPDGAGKTTLLRIMAGLMKTSSGTIQMASSNISYMPQKFGLYEDLTVKENLDLYADLHGTGGLERKEALGRLLSFTRLAPFTSRYAGKLSGGMKQKLGLACCLISRPAILLLDEPSVGVDPVSRRELWGMVKDLSDDGICVLWSTAYLDEAERCAEVLVLNEGKLLYTGAPDGLFETVRGLTFLVEMKDEKTKRHAALEAIQRSEVLDSVIQGSKIRLVLKDGAPVPSDLKGAKSVEPAIPRFEDAFVKLVGGIPKERMMTGEPSSLPSDKASYGNSFEVEIENLTKKFGSFTAVDNISFKVEKGEVFGLLGPNGAGKSTTFKIMCGLLQATSGTARVSGVDLIKAAAVARERIGYMAQKFSLYGDISVVDNLKFFGGVYGLEGTSLDQSVSSAIEQFQLAEYVNSKANTLPLGFKQRLSMACSTMHNPGILFLDEPTSGVDPLTRREFWGRINAMVERGVSIVVTTHFMDEAEYCDRIALIFAGRMIACDTPDKIKLSVASTELPDPTLEEAFIELIKRSLPGVNS